MISFSLHSKLWYCVTCILIHLLGAGAFSPELLDQDLGGSGWQL